LIRKEKDPFLSKSTITSATEGAPRRNARDLQWVGGWGGGGGGGGFDSSR